MRSAGERRPALGNLAPHVGLDRRRAARAREQRDAARNGRMDDAVLNCHQARCSRPGTRLSTGRWAADATRPGATGTTTASTGRRTTTATGGTRTTRARPGPAT